MCDLQLNHIFVYRTLDETHMKFTTKPHISVLKNSIEVLLLPYTGIYQHRQ